MSDWSETSRGTDFAVERVAFQAHLGPGSRFINAVC